MAYNELQSQANRLTGEQIAAQMRSLAASPHFPALIAWLDRYGDDWAATMTNQALAKDHGKLAHAAGSTYALNLLRQSLRTLVDKPARSKGNTMQPEE